MSELIITIEQLRGMIGIQVYYNSQACRVIEVLEDGPSLVLQQLEEAPSIQTNQYGNAHRRTPETFCIPVLSTTRTELSAPFLALDLI